MSRPGKFNWGENEEAFLYAGKPGNLPDDSGEVRLFPDDLLTGAASATECTGLIQTAAPFTEDMYKVYDDVYSYRETKPRQKSN